MDDSLPLDVFQVLSAVAEYRVYTISCPPNLFGNIVIIVLHKGIEKDVSNYPHPNPECTEKCTKCLLFAALTAVQVVFGYDSSQLSQTVKHLNRHDCLNPPEKIENYSCQKTLSCEQIETINKWYPAAAAILITDNFIHLLIEYVKSSCTFTAFLAKKSLLSALKTQVFEVHSFIKLVEQNWQAGINPCSSFVEVVKNLLSYKVPHISVCSETFACVHSFGYVHSFLSRKTDSKTETFPNTDGIFDYLCLIKKILKCGLKLIDCGLSQVSDYFILCSLFQNSILPYTEAFFSTIHTPHKHLICLKYLKCLSSLFDVKFLHPKNLPPQCIVIVGGRVSTALLRCLHSPSSHSLLADCNFVGFNLHKANSYQQSEDPKKGVSAMAKLLVYTVFKVHAITLIGNENFQPLIAAELFSLLCKVQELVTKCDQDSEDWLTVLFADQDDKWISSLLCLLMLHRKIMLRLEELTWSTSTEKVTSNKDFENLDIEKLCQCICPHRLFLQLAKFLGYDHLVLADFLTSPETHFLYYFSQYLHTVNENWTNFYTCVVSVSSNSSKVDTAISPKIDPDSSAIYNPTVLQNATSTSYYPTVQLVDECRSNLSYLHNHSNHLLLDVKRELSDEEKPDERKLYSNEKTDFQHLPLLRKENQVIDSFTHLIGPIVHNDSVVRKQQIVLVSYSDSDENEEEETTEKLNLVGGMSCYSDIIPSTNIEASIVCGNNEAALWKKNNSTDLDEHSSQEESSSAGLKIPEEVVLVMEMFIRLRLYLERLVDKNIFPYNVQPLILLLEVCEDTYDNFCTSSQM
ncbi:unnamed protein product [Lymnaea stagnalis]|uniref:Protein Lines n=1 Tax=Lymnaea stagnalis TaxID=6523 RepID=A0AAV2HEB3_LYMST